MTKRLLIPSNKSRKSIEEYGQITRFPPLIRFLEGAIQYSRLLENPSSNCSATKANRHFIRLFVMNYIVHTILLLSYKNIKTKD